MEGEPTRALELVAPFFTRAELNELCSGRQYEDYKRRKMQIFRWRWARAVWRQRQIAKELQGRQTRFVDGLGQHKAIVDPEFQMILQFVNRESWRDPEFRDACIRQLPELRVPSPTPRFHHVNGFRHGNGAQGDPATAGPASGSKEPKLTLGATVVSAHETPAPNQPKELT